MVRRALFGEPTVAKGVPVLIDAFRYIPGSIELILFGGWSTRAMRRYLHACMQADLRLRIEGGDPLRELQRADILVHPSYADGFGFAPMEALACGIPVIVTEDTGMKEYVQEGINGWIVRTGDVKALTERLRHAVSRVAR